MTADYLSWPFQPAIAGGLSALLVAYVLAATRFRAALLRLGGPPPRWLPPGALGPERPGCLSPWQAAAFCAGVAVAALALLSPLHVLGERYLLSAHMVQHLLLAQVVAPLLLLGTPGWMLRPLLRLPPAQALARSLLTPLPAFLLFNLVFAAWHVPPLYELALRVEAVHALEHTTMIGLALVTWWPVFGPLPELPRLPYPAQLLYLFFESLPPTIIGAIITLAEIPIYRTYWVATRVFGLEPLADQQLGGLIMWIPGALGYFTVLTIVFFLWMERRAASEEPPYHAVNPDRARAQARQE